MRARVRLQQHLRHGGGAAEVAVDLERRVRVEQVRVRARRRQEERDQTCRRARDRRSRAQRAARHAVAQPVDSSPRRSSERRAAAVSAGVRAARQLSARVDARRDARRADAGARARCMSQSSSHSCSWPSAPIRSGASLARVAASVLRNASSVPRSAAGLDDLAEQVPQDLAVHRRASRHRCLRVVAVLGRERGLVMSHRPLGSSTSVSRKNSAAPFITGYTRARNAWSPEYR